MSFFVPSAIPQVTFAPYAHTPRHSVGTLTYDQDYNHDLTAIKAHLRSLLKRNNLSGVRAGFPFHCVQDAYGRSSMSYASYEFQFREYFHSLELRSGLRHVTLRYTSPSSRPGSRMMDWSIVAPERQSLREANYAPGTVSIAHVQVNPMIMETSFGIVFMTNPRIVQEALALSIELGVLITIQMANRKTPMYDAGEIIFLSTDNYGRSEVVCAFRR